MQPSHFPNNLTSRQIVRYIRHLELPEWAEKRQKKLLASKILIVGAGGLGCPVSLYLCASGVGSITIMDDDIVSLSNLQRQVLYKTEDCKQSKTALSKKYLEQLNEDCTITAIEKRIDKNNGGDFIKDADVVVDASDNFQTRYLLNNLCCTYKKPLISGAVIYYDGQVSVFKGYENDLPCYQCAYPVKPTPQEVPSCTEAAVLSPIVGVVGTLMAVECLKELVNIGDSTAGMLNLYSGLSCQITKISIKKREKCPSCGV